MLCSCGYIWFEHKPQCNQKAHVGFISLCVFDKQKQHRLGHLSWLSNSGTFHKEELRELLWCQTEVAPCKKMVNVTFFGSKLSSSSGSPPVPALQFPFIHFLLDLPLTPLMAAFGDPATPKGDAKEKRRGDWKKERKKERLPWKPSLLHSKSVCLGILHLRQWIKTSFGEIWREIAETDWVPFTTGSN